MRTPPLRFGLMRIAARQCGRNNDLGRFRVVFGWFSTKKFVKKRTKFWTLYKKLRKILFRMRVYKRPRVRRDASSVRLYRRDAATRARGGQRRSRALPDRAADTTERRTSCVYAPRTNGRRPTLTVRWASCPTCGRVLPHVRVCRHFAWQPNPTVERVLCRLERRRPDQHRVQEDAERPDLRLSTAKVAACRAPLDRT